MKRTRNTRLMSMGFVALVASSMTFAFPQTTQATDQPLPFSQFIQSTNATVCNADPVITTYHGTMIFDLPISTMLASFENEIRAAAAQGKRPHLPGSYYDYPDLELAVTFPDGVRVGGGAYLTSSSLIGYGRFGIGRDAQTATFSAYFNDMTWQELYDRYTADKADPGQHTVRIKIPYAIGANNAEDAARIAQERITSKATFNFYALDPSTAGSSISPNKVIVSSLASTELVSTPTDCFSPAPQRTTRWVDEADGRELRPAATGPNFFLPVGFPDYEFVSAQASADRLSGTYTYRRVFAPLPENGNDDIVSSDFTLKTDDNPPLDNQNSVVRARSAQSRLTTNNIVHMKDLRGGRIADLLKKYADNPNDFNDMTMKDTQITFTTEITLPEELRFTDESVLSVSGTPEGFSVSTSAIHGKQATVTVSVDNPETLTTFELLKSAVEKLDGDLTVSVNNVAFTEQAQANTDYTITQQVKGRISSTASKQLGVLVRPGTPSPACPPVGYVPGEVNPVEPYPVSGSPFDGPAPVCPPSNVLPSAPWTVPMTGPAAGFPDAPTFEHSFIYTTSGSNEAAVSFTAPLTPAQTPPAPSTPVTRLAKTGALTSLLMLAAGASVVGAASTLRKRA